VLWWSCRSAPTLARPNPRSGQLAILKDRGSDWLEGLRMSLGEVLPGVQSLSRLDKIRLIQFLAQELERDDAGLIESGRSYPVWSPDRAFSAAAALLHALAEDQGSLTHIPCA
jgi:hypothetical protein